MSGFIVMHRDALDHPLLKDADRFRAWFWLVANAAWRPTRTRIKGQTITLERGQLSFSQRFMAEAWGWSKSRVDRFIAELRDEGMISTCSKIGATAGHNAGQGQSIISICNYDKYQDVKDDDRGNDDAKSGATAGQQRGKEEQGNKGTIKEEPIGSSPPEGSKPRKSRSHGTNERAQGLNPRATGRNDRAKPVPDVDIPDWIPAEQWNAFLEMRRDQKKNPTPRAVSLLIGKLERLRSSGHDPGAVLDQSTLRNWTDVYAIKDGNHGQRQHTARDRRDGFEQAADRRIFGN